MYKFLGGCCILTLLVWLSAVLKCLASAPPGLFEASGAPGGGGGAGPPCPPLPLPLPPDGLKALIACMDARKKMFVYLPTLA